jgi:hypothetical protein
MKSRLMSLMLSAPLLCIPFDNYYFDFDSCGSVFLFLNTYVFGNLICLPCLWSLLLCSFNDSKFQREFMLVALIMFQLFGFEEATPGMLTNIACDAYRQPNLEWRYPNFESGERTTKFASINYRLETSSSDFNRLERCGIKKLKTKVYKLVRSEKGSENDKVEGHGLRIVERPQPSTPVVRIVERPQPSTPVVMMEHTPAPETKK